MDGGRVDDVVVVQRHHRGTGEDVEIVDQADQNILAWRGSADLQQGESLNPHLGDRHLNRGHEVAQKHSDVRVAGVETQPRHPELRRAGRLRQPLRQQCGLAEPGRCRDEHQSRPLTSGHQQLIGDAGTRHQSPTRRGQVQLRAQHGHRVSVDPLWSTAPGTVDERQLRTARHSRSSIA